MGAQSVLRNAVVLTLAAAGFVTPASADDQSDRAGEVVLVIDLSRAGDAERTTRRAAVHAAVSESQRLRRTDDEELEVALAGVLRPLAERRGADAVEASEVAQAANRCPEADASARLAVLELAAAQAAGGQVTPLLLRAHAALFRCAHANGDVAAAMTVVKTLRALGADRPPSGVSAEVWDLYPDVDATANLNLAELTIQSDPPGADIWVDFIRRGKSPAVIHLPQGDHVVAAGADDLSAAAAISVTDWTHTETLRPARQVSRWTRVNALVAALRERRVAADAQAIGEVMATAGARLAMVLLDGGLSEGWAAAPGGPPLMIGRRRVDGQTAELLAEAVTSDRAPDPDQPLLRETDAERKARDKAKDSRTRWWVYAAVLGAAAVGAGIIIFGEAGDDRQRFEINLP